MEILGPISTFAKSSSVLEVTSDAAFTHSHSCLIFGLLFLLWLKKYSQVIWIIVSYSYSYSYVWIILIHCSPVLIKHPCSVSRLFRMNIISPLSLFISHCCLFSYTGSPSTLEFTLRVWFWIFPTVWKSTSVNQTTLHPCVPITSLRLCDQS